LVLKQPGLPLDHANPTKLEGSDTLMITNMAQHRVGVDETPTIINDGPDLAKEQTLDSETSSNTKAEVAPPLESVTNGTDGPWNEHTLEKPGTYDKVKIAKDDCHGKLGFLSVMEKMDDPYCHFPVQVSMNFNTSLYSNAIDGISSQYHVGAQAARCGAVIFLVFYAFGCELWAPWSEELGRKPVL
jgi:hypothetical protein